jgi:hypothetical protein
MRLFNTEMLCLERFSTESRPSPYRGVRRYGALRVKRAHRTQKPNRLAAPLSPLCSIWAPETSTRFDRAA